MSTVRGRPVALLALCPGLLALCFSLLPTGPAGARSARADYTLGCMGCHLEDGSETPGKVPALKGRIGKYLQVPGGREYLVQVPGTAQSLLTDAQIAGVLNWMLANFSPGEIPKDFVPYTEAEVARLRTPLTDVVSVRDGLLRQIELLERQ